MTEEPRRSRWARVVVPAIVVAALAIIALLVAVATDDGDDDISTATTTEPGRPTTTERPTSTTTSTSTPTSTSAPDGAADTNAAVWPAPSGTDRFDDPVELARRFAIEYVGFTDPEVGEFRQGDSRSGEVEVRPRTDGPVTTVLLRQLGADSSWWVIGTATANIEVDEPTALATIADPVRLRGRALAFEGNVNVELRSDGADEPIATGYVTGRGDGQLGPFDSTIQYRTPPSGWGSVLFLTYSAENGQVWEAAVIRIRFPPP